jgi:hypothetical protein
MGNQSAYDTWGNISVGAAGLFIPIGSGLNAAKTAGVLGINGVTRVVGVEVGKYAISAGAGTVGSYAGTYYGTEYFGAEAGRWIGLGTGLAAGIGVGFGANGLAKTFNLNGLQPSAVAKSVVKVNGIKSLDEVNAILEKEGLNQVKIDEILSMSKKSRPDPSTYLSPEYINKHLQTFMENGAVKIMPSEPVGTIGGRGGTFVMSSDDLASIIKSANGNISEIETILGFDKGYLGNNPVIVKFTDPSGLRIPQGNELGANDYWKPGGYTSGVIKEGVINPAPEGTYILIGE